MIACSLFYLFSNYIGEQCALTTDHNFNHHEAVANFKLENKN